MIDGLGGKHKWENDKLLFVFPDRSGSCATISTDMYRIHLEWLSHTE